MTYEPNTPFAVLITADNVGTIHQHLPGSPRMFGYPLKAFTGFYLVYRPLGGGYAELFWADDFDRIYEFIAGKEWDTDNRFQKIQQKSINPFD